MKELIESIKNFDPQDIFLVGLAFSAGWSGGKVIVTAIFEIVALVVRHVWKWIKS